MFAFKLETSVTEDHRIVVDLPADFPEGGAEIIVLAKPGAEKPRGETLLDILDWLGTQPPTGRSKEEIDAQIAEERASWGDR
jgi:hypothetical protein